jgi:hypothetical protein
MDGIWNTRERVAQSKQNLSREVSELRTGRQNSWLLKQLLACQEIFRSMKLDGRLNELHDYVSSEEKWRWWRIRSSEEAVVAYAMSFA